jgi:sugar/nucleoside kinase (ribokinase family)
VLLCCGLSTLDLIQTVDRLPGPDEKLQASSAILEVGGPAANAALTAALLDRPVRLMTALGTGPLAITALAGLTSAGVDVVDAAPADAGWQLPISSVLITAGSGQRAVVSGNSLAAPVPSWTPGAMAGVTAVLVDGHHSSLALAAAAAAREAGVPVLFDGGSWKEITPRLLPYVDIAVLSADFRVPGVGALDTLRAVRRFGPSIVAVTRGAAPILLLEEGSAMREIEVPVPERVVDTVGAGDVLHGALGALMSASAYTGTDIDRLVALAARVASLSCAYAGPRGWAGSVEGRDRARSVMAD